VRSFRTSRLCSNHEMPEFVDLYCTADGNWQTLACPKSVEMSSGSVCPRHLAETRTGTVPTWSRLNGALHAAAELSP
jgi:hypothetical protein